MSCEYGYTLHASIPDGDVWQPGALLRCRLLLSISVKGEYYCSALCSHENADIRACTCGSGGERGGAGNETAPWGGVEVTVGCTCMRSVSQGRGRRDSDHEMKCADLRRVLFLDGEEGRGVYLAPLRVRASVRVRP